MIGIVLPLSQAITHPEKKPLFPLYLAGFWIKGHLALGAGDLFIDLIGKQFHLRLAGRTGDLDRTQ
ncbi:hypothetical protein [Desulfoprunum benzoelyticum]|uniref:hypothetical protein n=1 Tax=Desulfoprunum benzoelyticum TaxID=1506996 RepID=UPI001964F37B|nr:hypothetical protein [Desulfoprunum benzoelyticum]